jgi:hypothetical protein
MIHERRVINEEKETAGLLQLLDCMHNEVETEHNQAILVLVLKLLRLDSTPERNVRVALKHCLCHRLDSHCWVNRNLHFGFCQMFQAENFFDHDHFVADVSVKHLRVDGILLTLAHVLRVDFK